MKRFVVFTLLILSLVAVSSSYAAEAFSHRNYGTAGCGLGSMLFGDEKGTVQIFAATTNGTSGNQTFGITSGTLNCGQPIKLSGNERLNEFVLANMDSLAKDVAVGKGESLETLTELLNISKDQRPAVCAKLKDNFSKIFTSEKVQLADVIDNIITVINS